MTSSAYTVSVKGINRPRCEVIQFDKKSKTWRHEMSKPVRLAKITSHKVGAIKQQTGEIPSNKMEQNVTGTKRITLAMSVLGETL